MKKILPMLLLASGLAHADFSETKTVNGDVLQKAGEANYSYLLIDITDTALYVDPAQAKPKSIMAPAYTKAIEIEYQLDVDAKKFVELTHEALRKGWPKETLALYKDDIDAFCALYQDVKEDDRYVLTWKNGAGLSLALNGEKLGTVKNSSAAYVILSVWLGQAVLDKKHLNRLLIQWREG